MAEQKLLILFFKFLTIQFGNSKARNKKVIETKRSLLAT